MEYKQVAKHAWEMKKGDLVRLPDKNVWLVESVDNFRMSADRVTIRFVKPEGDPQMLVAMMIPDDFDFTTLIPKT